MLVLILAQRQTVELLLTLHEGIIVMRMGNIKTTLLILTVALFLITSIAFGRGPLGLGLELGLDSADDTTSNLTFGSDAITFGADNVTGF